MEVRSNRSANTAESANTARTTPIILRPPGSTYLAQRLAYTAVFERWGVNYLEAPTNLIPCYYAPSAGLQCLGRHGSWSEIERLNLPVVLELWDDQASPYYAGLTQLNEDALQLHIGDSVITATPRDLRDLWYGAYVLLWQTPPGYHGSLRQGDSHQTVSWLRQQFAALNSEGAVVDKSELFGARSLEYMRELIPQDFPAVAVADAQHHVFLDEPLAFVEALKDMLENLRRSAVAGESR